MYDFSYPLGNAVKSTRYQRGLTQLQVADMADIDVRTVMNIENYKACLLYTSPSPRDS